LQDVAAVFDVDTVEIRSSALPRCGNVRRSHESEMTAVLSPKGASDYDSITGSEESFMVSIYDD
jgi:hypothetical protein